MSRIFHDTGTIPRAGEGQRVFLATPAYDGLSAGYSESLFASQRALMNAGIPAELAIFAGNCHVDDSRNQLVREFLETDCTDLLFLDADVSWDADALVRLCRHDRDVVGGCYPLRSSEEKYPVVHLGAPGAEINSAPDGLIEVEHTPTGFLKIRRAALERLAEEAISHSLSNDKPGRMAVPIIFERTVVNNVRRGGDVTFCHKWRDAGGSVWIDPEMWFEHFGEHSWNGSYAAYLRRTNGLTITQVLAHIRNGSETPGMMVEIVETWGNPMFALAVEPLVFAVDLARNVKGPILECGSGLSTLAMAAATDQEVWALEHDPIWAESTRQKAIHHGLSNVHIVDAPLKVTDGVSWYETEGLPESFAMALLDGPPRKNQGGRRGFESMIPMLRPGGHIIADDADDMFLPMLREWEERHGLGFHLLGKNRRFAVSKTPGSTATTK